jgi:V8-like Glu-specific endopeptidase
VALNFHCANGNRLRGTGFLVANRVVVTVGHITGVAREHGGITAIDILPPSGPSSPNTAPTAIPGLAYQVEPAYTHPNGVDDVMLIYFQGALPARAQPQSPVVNYESALGCRNPGNCTARNVQITGTGTVNVFTNGEWERPQIRMGQTVIYYQEQQGNSQWLYLYPPITQNGDSGAPVWIDGQIIGIVWGTWPIPTDYEGQAHPNHLGTVVQILNGDRLQNMITTFQNNVRDLVAGNQLEAPWRTDDHRFGILRDYRNPGPNNQYWTLATLTNALAAFLYYAQANPPQGGCKHN